MISTRESVFESNSSSCHSVTICKKSLREKLENGEAFYKGDFEFHDDYETYFNKLDENEIVSGEDAAKALNEWAKQSDLKSWWQSTVNYLIAHPATAESLKELCTDKSLDNLDIFGALGEALECELTDPRTMFGSDDSDSTCVDEESYDLADGDVLEIRNVSISC